MLSDLEFITEIRAVERLRQALAGRRDVPPAERLEYRQRRAALLSEVAERTGLPKDQEWALKAQASVDALLAGVG